MPKVKSMHLTQDLTPLVRARESSTRCGWCFAHSRAPQKVHANTLTRPDGHPTTPNRPVQERSHGRHIGLIHLEFDRYLLQPADDRNDLA